MIDLARFKLLVLTAARSVTSHRTKSLIVGLLLAFGTTVFIIGTSLLDSVEDSMRRAVTGSLSGDLHVYSAEAEDELALFAGEAFGGEDIGELDNFPEIVAALEQVDNVEAVVPMGLVQARVVAPAKFDAVLAELRRAVRAEDFERAETLGVQIRAMATELRETTANRAAIAADDQTFADQLAALDRVLSDAFWQTELRTSPEQALEFLDVQVAPLAGEGKLYVLRMLGTDPVAFGEHFQTFKVARGQPIPSGRRGILIAERSYEKWMKNEVAEELDEMKELRELEGLSFADDATLQNEVDEIQEQWRELTFGVAPWKLDEVRDVLRDYLSMPDAELDELMPAFLELDDHNFDERYAFFYDAIAPIVPLYPFEVGDTLTLQAMSQGGYLRSTTVEMFGTFTFEGMEDSRLSSSVQIIDLETFRQLYGVMTEAERAELEALRADVGVADVRRDEAEDALFGGGEAVVANEGPDAVQPAAVEDAAARPAGDDPAADDPAADDPAAEDIAPVVEIERASATYDPATLEQGVVRSAAIILRDPDKLSQTQRRIEAVIAEQDLGIRVTDWLSASGIVGQFVTVVRLVLYVALVIIFLVALVIINNTMVMATVERTAEIGTMRAIGARRGYIQALFFLETLILGLGAGILGCAVGGAAIAIAGEVGIPATTQFLRFVFSGQALYPTLEPINVAIALGIILVVSLVSTVYPARLAARVQPVVAMRHT